MKRFILRLTLASFLVAALGASGLMCARVAERGRYAAPYSTIGSGPEGGRALFLLAERLGRHPQRWARDLGGLPEGGILMALGGCGAELRRDMSPFEERALVAWVEAGGVLIIAGAVGYAPAGLGARLTRDVGQCGLGSSLRDLFGEDEEAPREGASDAFGPRVEGPLDDGDAQAEAHWARVSDELFVGLGALPLREPARIRLDEGKSVRRHLELEGEAAALSLSLGRGTVYMISSASLLRNGELLETDGGAMIARIWRRHRDAGVLYFDEYHLGVGATRSIVQYAREVGGGALWFQLLVLLAFIFWRRGTRFGAPREAPEAIPGGTASFLESLGQLYRRSADAKAALAIVGSRAIARMARHHHQPMVESRALVAALEARDEGAADAVRELERLRNAPVQNETELIRHVRAIDAVLARQTEQEKAPR